MFRNTSAALIIILSLAVAPILANAEHGPHDGYGRRMMRLRGIETRVMHPHKCARGNAKEITEAACSFKHNYGFEAWMSSMELSNCRVPNKKSTVKGLCYV